MASVIDQQFEQALTELKLTGLGPSKIRGLLRLKRHTETWLQAQDCLLTDEHIAALVAGQQDTVRKQVLQECSRGNGPSLLKQQRQEQEILIRYEEYAKVPNSNIVNCVLPALKPLRLVLSHVFAILQLTIILQKTFTGDIKLEEHGMYKCSRYPFIAALPHAVQTGPEERVVLVESVKKLPDKLPTSTEYKVSARVSHRISKPRSYLNPCMEVSLQVKAILYVAKEGNQLFHNCFPKAVVFYVENNGKDTRCKHFDFEFNDKEKQNFERVALTRATVFYKGLLPDLLLARGHQAISFAPSPCALRAPQEMQAATSIDEPPPLQSPTIRIGKKVTVAGTTRVRVVEEVNEETGRAKLVGSKKPAKLANLTVQPIDEATRVKPTSTSQRVRVIGGTYVGNEGTIQTLNPELCFVVLDGDNKGKKIHINYLDAFGARRAPTVPVKEATVGEVKEHEAKINGAIDNAVVLRSDISAAAFVKNALFIYETAQKEVLAMQSEETKKASRQKRAKKH